MAVSRCLGCCSLGRAHSRLLGLIVGGGADVVAKQSLDATRKQFRVRPVTEGAAPIERALVVVAHPDDVDFGAAGTVSGWVAEGVQVSYCICTSGDAGGFDDTPRAQIGPLRESEQKAAAAELGVQDLTFLHYQDGRVTPSIELGRDISREIRRVRPQRVLAPSPGDLLGTARRLHTGPPRGRRGRVGCRLPGCAQPVRPSGATRRRGPRRLDGGGTLAHGRPPERAQHVRGGHHTDLRPQDRRAAGHVSQTGRWTELEQRIRAFGAATAARFRLPEGHIAEVFRSSRSVKRSVPVDERRTPIRVVHPVD